MKKFESLIVSLISFSFLLAVWEILFRIESIDAFYFSSPSLIIEQIVNWHSEGSIYADIGFTLTSVVSGLAISLVVGIGLALIVSQFRYLEWVFLPILTALNSIPRPALAPLFVLWFGVGLESKLALVVSLVSFLVFFSVFDAIQRINKIYSFHVQMLGGSNFSVWRHVNLPAVTGAVATSLRLGVAYSIIGAIIGEMIASTAGLGVRISESQGNFDSTGMLSAVTILALIALVLDQCCAKLHSVIAPWSVFEKNEGII